MTPRPATGAECRRSRPAVVAGRTRQRIHLIRINLRNLRTNISHSQPIRSFCLLPSPIRSFFYTSIRLYGESHPSPHPCSSVVPSFSSVSIRLPSAAWSIPLYVYTVNLFPLFVIVLGGGGMVYCPPMKRQPATRFTKVVQPPSGMDRICKTRAAGWLPGTRVSLADGAPRGRGTLLAFQMAR